MKALVALLLLVGSFSDAAETAPAPAPAPSLSPSAHSSISSNWQFGLGLGFSLASKVKFDDGTVTSGGTSYPVKADLDYKNALMLDAEGRYMPENSWGCILGLQIDGEREFDSGTITVNGVTFTSSGSGTGSKIQASNLFVNAVYRWEQFYLPFGLNVSSVKYTAPSGFSGTTDVSGSVGAQLGVGYMLDDHWALELMSRSIGFKLKSTSSAGNADYGYGYLSALLFTGKYIF